MKFTQNERVLKLLQARGEHGVTANDFSPPQGSTVTDGGSRITRLAARIRDLRDQGHLIDHVEDRGGFAVYALRDPLSHRERPEVAASAFRLAPFTIDTTDGPVTIVLEVLNPGWHLTNDGRYVQVQNDERNAA